MKKCKNPIIRILALLMLISPQSCKDKPVIPTLTTVAISEITQTSALSGGKISDNGGSEISARGVCWNTNHNPTTDSEKSTDGTGNGTFVSSLSALSPDTKYFIRAYATNSEGTAYGNEISFTTTAVLLPQLTTTAVTGITSSSAISGGNITSDGGGGILARGVCWDTNPNPDISKFITTQIGGQGEFTANITALNSSTKYYLRAFATNIIGTAYGNEVSFITLDPSITDGLVAYYPFNGNADDASGNGNSGAVFGAVLTEDRFGSPNSAYSFNGNSDYILVNDSPSLDIKGEITLAGWRYITSNSLGRIIRKVNTWGPAVGGYILSSAADYINSELQLDINTSGVIITRKDSIFPMNKWGFVAMTYDGKTVSLYYNESRIQTAQVTGQINTNDNPVYIGSSEGVEYFAGKIDDVRIYNRAMNETEIKNLYNLTK